METRQVYVNGVLVAELTMPDDTPESVWAELIASYSEQQNPDDSTPITQEVDPEDELNAPSAAAVYGAIQNSQFQDQTIVDQTITIDNDKTWIRGNTYLVGETEIIVLGTGQIKFI